MTIFTRRKSYKALEPYKTISIIRNILNVCDLFVSESNISFSEPELSSCRIWLSDPDINDGDFGTNGKGMSPRYALASAYGEFIERLQSFALFGDYVMSIGFSETLPHFVAPDELMMSASECFDQAKEVIMPVMRIDKKDAKDIEGCRSMPCVPFYDVFGKKRIYLPYNTLRSAVSTNGLAAGNTAAEALIQGISELYERYAVALAYRENPEIKKIDPARFAESEVYNKLERLRLFGYDFDILDLSMGIGLPVTGLRIKAGRAAAFRAGADPCPITALERCLTELFQGSDEEVYGKFKTNGCAPYPAVTDRKLRRRINEEAIAYHVDGTGLIADCLYNPSNAFAEEIPGTDAADDASDLDFLINLTKKLGFGLYIRDWSFLGFPTYQIIIPEISNYDIIYENGVKIYNTSFQKPKLRPDRFTNGIEKRLKTLFEKYEKNIPNQHMGE